MRWVCHMDNGVTTKRVCHVITGLNTGGAERMLTRLVGAPGQTGLRHVVVSLMDEGVFGNEIRSKGVELYTLGMRRGAPSLHALWRLIKILRHEKPDIVMTWLYHADLLGSITAWFAGVPQLYWNLRCSDMTQAAQSLSSRLLRWALTRLSSYPTAVIANSEAGKRHHQSLGYRPKAWHVISNGVNLDQFHPDPHAGAALRAELGLTEKVVLIGHLARFHPMKGHAFLLNAASKVILENDDAQFVLAGRDVTVDTPFFAEQLSRTELAGRIHVLGDRRDIPRILAGFDMLVLSSSYGEGAPNVVIEAMACGIPCVVTDVGDAALIVDGAGRTAPPHDEPALANAILDILALSQAERQSLGRQARARAEEFYAIEAVTKRYRSLFWAVN